MIVVGASVGVGVMIAASRQRSASQGIAANIEPLLRARGPMTLPQLQEALAMQSFSGRGKVAMALNAMVAAQTLEVVEAPPGTPQLEKVKVIQYKLRAS